MNKSLLDKKLRDTLLRSAALEYGPADQIFGHYCETMMPSPDASCFNIYCFSDEDDNAYHALFKVFFVL